jgi:hypothetical protein
MPFLLPLVHQQEKPVSAALPIIEVVTHTPPDRLNEDAWLAMQTGPLEDRLLIAAIDGATTRLTPPRLQHYLDSCPVRLTPAAYAARAARDSLARHAADGLFADPRALLLEANADLGRALIQLFGALTLEGMGFPEEVYNALAQDPRRVRLALPAAVSTLAAYDPAERTLHYAHAGDTLLLVAYADGRVTIPTRPADSDFDKSVLRTADQLRDIHPNLPFRELVQHEQIRALNLETGLRHNYVDEHGLPQPRQGIGVIDGLPELRYFVQSGNVPLDGAAFVCVMTDGLEWPADAQEAFAADADEAASRQQARCEFMARKIDELGLHGYLDLLRRAEAGDPDHERYPRMKTCDDATGVLLRF